MGSHFIIERGFFITSIQGIEEVTCLVVLSFIWVFLEKVVSLMIGVKNIHRMQKWVWRTEKIISEMYETISINWKLNIRDRIRNDKWIIRLELEIFFCLFHFRLCRIQLVYTHIISLSLMKHVIKYLWTNSKIGIDVCPKEHINNSLI